MAWSKRRKWFVLALAVFVLVAFAAMRLQPASPMRKACDEIRVGMTYEQVLETLKRCGCRDDATTFETIYMPAACSLEYEDEAGSGEKLKIHWEGHWDHGGRIPQGHVVGKEYHSGIEEKLRDLWYQLRFMLNW